MQSLLDKICKAYHLHTLSEDIGVTCAEYKTDRKKKKYKNKKDNKSYRQEKKI